MSLEQPQKEELSLETQGAIFRLKEKNPNSLIVVYLETLSSNELRILDTALNSDGATFYTLNIYEGEEAEKAKAVLEEIIEEPDTAKHQSIIKKLP